MEVTPTVVGAATLYRGDCRDILPSLPLVDAVVTDPPYDLGLMGQAWDAGGVAFDPALWAAVAAVMKPGAHLLAFGAPRTYHRLACAVEAAGFEIRDQVMWIYGSGFPKGPRFEGAWAGWGTDLKPAHEPIVLARKPFPGPVARNLAGHRVGAVNVDGCRVAAPDGVSGGGGKNSRSPLHADRRVGTCRTEARSRPHPSGRWPANVIHDGSREVLAAFPTTDARPAEGPGGRPLQGGECAARFFYCAKPDRRDRGAGNDHPAVKPTPLLRYLCRLVTPPGGIVLDPFMGSGSTGKAALLEGLRFIGIEKDGGFLSTARGRIAAADRGAGTGAADDSAAR